MNINMSDPIESVSFAKAMADETRQRVMSLLCCRWLCVGDIVEEMHGVTQPTVSHHLAILREVGLVHTRREGKQIFYTLDQDRVAVCCGRIMHVFAPERADAPALVGLSTIEAVDLVHD
jgi:ArsR family transcriptional regulator